MGGPRKGFGEWRRLLCAKQRHRAGAVEAGIRQESCARQGYAQSSEEEAGHQEDICRGVTRRTSCAQVCGPIFVRQVGRNLEKQRAGKPHCRPPRACATAAIQPSGRRRSPPRSHVGACHGIGRRHRRAFHGAGVRDDTSAAARRGTTIIAVRIRVPARGAQRTPGRRSAISSSSPSSRGCGRDRPSTSTGRAPGAVGSARRRRQ